MNIVGTVYALTKRREMSVEQQLALPAAAAVLIMFSMLQAAQKHAKAGYARLVAVAAVYRL